MIDLKYSFFLIAILIVQTFNQDFIDLTEQNKYGSRSLEDTLCNKDTVIDFSFSSKSILSSCNTTDSSCKIASPSSSSLTFLNDNGQEITYPLTMAEVENTSYTIPTRGNSSFKLTYFSGSKTVIVIVPFNKTITPPQNVYDLNLDDLNGQNFNVLKGVTNQFSTRSGLPLSAFNFLNEIDYGHFYHVADSDISTTYLINYWVLVISGIDQTDIEPFDTSTTFTPDYSKTAGKLCYGSFSEGIFQTHLRESYPLWTAWVGILFFWLSVLFSQQNTLSCYDKQFQQNKWTCWGMYSLFYLGNEEVFTTLSRTTLILITFSWQGCVLGVLYGTVGPDFDAVTIVWFSFIALFTSMPFTYLLGFLFLTKIYDNTIHKYEVIKKMKGVFNKKAGLQSYEKQIDDTEQSLYGLYYWYYITAFIFFIVFWVISIYMMMQLSRQYFRLMYYWIASVGATFFLDHFVFDPFLTFLLGNTSFYRVRGFFYDFKLGQLFKQVEE